MRLIVCLVLNTTVYNLQNFRIVVSMICNHVCNNICRIMILYLNQLYSSSSTANTKYMKSQCHGYKHILKIKEKMRQCEYVFEWHLMRNMRMNHNRCYKRNVTPSKFKRRLNIQQNIHYVFLISFALHCLIIIIKQIICEYRSKE